MGDELIHDAESVPKLYRNAGMLGYLIHVEAVNIGLSLFIPSERLGMRLSINITTFQWNLKRRVLKPMAPHKYKANRTAIRVLPKVLQIDLIELTTKKLV